MISTEKYRVKFLIILMLLVFMRFGISQNSEIINIEKITSDTISLDKPVWNATGETLLLTGKNNKGLYTLNLTNRELSCINKDIKISGVPLWLKNNVIVSFEKNKPLLINDFKTSALTTSDTILKINIKNQSVDLFFFSENLEKPITTKRGLYYNPILSPDKSQAIIHLKSEMYLLKTDGSGELIRLGTGIASSWSPDSKTFFYFLDESSDGHRINNSEIYMMDIVEKNPIKITDTPDIMEMWPSVSPDGKQIAFSNCETGEIFIGELKTVSE
ncbi:MAG: PD40 domain-containing protein [Bacteroidales bacterium]|nr:PD40 domain-containing protein [Bacteroidales bacterium]MBN2817388.1 PD40 domain-containing protein [Bacteroidales bacterium]